MTWGRHEHNVFLRWDSIGCKRWFVDRNLLQIPDIKIQISLEQDLEDLKSFNKVD
jgi:hypothetical protein